MVSLTKLPRETNATFQWLDGHAERCLVLSIKDGCAYTAWPMSIRTVRYPDGFVTAMRPNGWSPMERISLDAAA